MRPTHALLSFIFLAASLCAQVPRPSATAAPTPAASLAPSAAASVASSASPTPSASAIPGASAVATASPSPGTRDLVAETLPLDISTAGFYLLVDWCRSLGLATTGTAAELRTRLYSFYGVAPPPEATVGQTIIEILSSDKTEYFSVEADGEDYIRLSGKVRLKLTDKARGWIHDIAARQIVYNKTIKLLSAEGDVNYTLQRQGSSETFRGDRIVVDLDTWTGDFIDGTVYRSGSADSKGGTTFSFGAQEIRKGEGDLISFDGAVITSCGEDEPHYSIRASKAWLLGKNEWALLNAVLSVGEVPLLYLPFFWYSGEELVFHPVFGTRTREGAYFQSTIYLLGQKPPAKDSISLLQLTEADAGTEKELRGFYLMSTDRKATGASPHSLKLMLDAYAGLGAFAAAKGSFAGKGFLKKIDASLILGATRTLYPQAGGTYSPYTAMGDTDSDWNGSWIFGARIPFVRYAADLGASLSAGAFTFTLALPAVSDPFVEQDFGIRSEDMDWLGALKGATPTATGSERATASMKASVSGNPSVKELQPWVSGLSLTRLNTDLSWVSKAALDEDGSPLSAYDPERKFFHPDRLTIVDVTATARGSLFSWPPKPKPARATAQGTTEKGWAAGSDGLPLPPPRSPSTTAKDGATEDEGRDSPSAPAEEGPRFRLRDASTELPSQSAPSSAPTTFSVGWSLTPYALLERRFLSAPWNRVTDIDFQGTPLYDTRSWRVNGDVNAQASVLGGFLGGTATLTALAQDQDRINATDDPAYLTQAALEALRLQDYRYRNTKLSGSLSLTSSPLKGIDLLSSSSLRYSLTALLYNEAFKELSGATPVYQVTTPSWTKESITAHSLAATLSAHPLGWSESLSLGADLPPRTPAYNGSLSLQAWTLNASASLRVYQNEATQAWTWDPFTPSISWRPHPSISLTGSYGWNLMEGRPLSGSASLSLWSFTSIFSLAWAQNQILRIPTGWETVPDSWALRPSAVTASWNSPQSPEIRMWKDRVALKGSVNTSLSMNLQRFTESVFNFTFNGSASIEDFLTLNLSTNSQNAAVYRYLVGLPGFEVQGAELEPINPLVDLLKSFNFFQGDKRDRKASNFKLKSINLTLSHRLHDWDLAFGLTGKPVLVTAQDGSRRYEFKPEWNLSLNWKDIPEIKAKAAWANDSLTIE